MKIINDPTEAITHFKKNVLPNIKFENEEEKRKATAYANRPKNDWSPNKVNQFLEKYSDHCSITWQYTFSEKVEQNEGQNEK